MNIYIPIIVAFVEAAIIGFLVGYGRFRRPPTLGYKELMAGTVTAKTLAAAQEIPAPRIFKQAWEMDNGKLNRTLIEVPATPDNVAKVFTDEVQS